MKTHIFKTNLLHDKKIVREIEMSEHNALWQESAGADSLKQLGSISKNEIKYYEKL